MDRPFSLADALVLIAATAVGLSLTGGASAVGGISHRVLVQFGSRPIMSSELEVYATSLMSMPAKSRLSTPHRRATAPPVRDS